MTSVVHAFKLRLGGSATSSKLGWRSPEQLAELVEPAPWQVRNVMSAQKNSTVTGTKEELLRVMRDWDRAMTTNEADAIGRYMAEDWTIIGSDGRVGSKASFLALVKSGALSHEVMETHEPDIRVYGESAVIISRGVSGGQFRGRQFLEVERVSCVFVRGGREWRCVLTHLLRLSE